MPKIPPAVMWNHTPLLESGLKHLFTGKVRETYEIPSRPDVLLIVSTDRISIFDVIINQTVKDKGAILTALTTFWLREIITGIVPNHLIAFGKQVNNFLPKPLSPEILKRAMIVRRLNMLPFEFIARGYLTGSGLKAYNEQNRVVCGHLLPEGLHDGSRLSQPICTPTTKSQDGHDEHVNISQIDSDIEKTVLDIYRFAQGFAEVRNIIIADTKFELGHDCLNNRLTLGDEIFTPDSSRFWLKDEWIEARTEGKSPPSGLDKQPVREWGKGVFDKINPENQADLDKAWNIVMPSEVIKQTTERYRNIFKLLTRMELEEFQLKYGI
ncbi:MAG: phosphoribosylaminoimidazolesuccinocarboxamide synthase [Patescibacteria group bacterium]|jgi:phosphoribosylaminoimidazole-succinocarboxamide synthase